MTEAIRKDPTVRVRGGASGEKDADSETDFVAGVKEGEIEGESGAETTFDGAEEEAGCHHPRPSLGCGLEGGDGAPEEDYDGGVSVRGE